MGVLIAVRPTKIVEFARFKFEFYEFEKRGLGLPLHTHEWDHWTFIVAGGVKMLDTGNILHAGDTLFINRGKLHGFECVEPTAIIINVTRLLS